MPKLLLIINCLEIYFLRNFDTFETLIRALLCMSGKKTTGIDFFFSSILQKPIKSLCFSGLSIIVPNKNKSYPLLLSQLIFTPEKKEIAKQKKRKLKSQI